MGDRGVAQVVDLATLRARRGAQIGRGHARRTNPGLRPPVIAGGRVRRSGVRLVKRATALTRQQRRLAWKVEWRSTGVAWAQSRSARGELAPIIPIRSRSLHARQAVPPYGVDGTAIDLMGGAGVEVA